jgi:hypothetical protein
MECFTTHSAKTFRTIQGLTTLIGQQKAELNALVANYVDEIGAVGPLSDNAIAELDPALHAFSGRYAVSLEEVREFLIGLASWVETIVDEAGEDERHDLLLDIGMAFVVACDRIDDICVQRDSTNSPDSNQSLPPVLPHELVKMSPADFIRMTRKQAYRLEHRYSVEQIDVIADQHKALLRAYRSEAVLRAGIDACDARTSFETAWTALSAQFPDLVEFCGGLATIFPGTATVESDFSILRWEKDAFRKDLSDFSLEGVLQTKQYQLLDSLVAIN